MSKVTGKGGLALYKHLVEETRSYAKQLGLPLNTSFSGFSNTTPNIGALFGNAAQMQEALRDPDRVINSATRIPNWMSEEDVAKYYSSEDQRGRRDAALRMIKDYNDVAKHFDEILSGAPKLPEGVTVYRAAPRGVYPGTDPGYMFTSMRKNAAEQFAPQVRVFGMGNLEGGLSTWDRAPVSTYAIDVPEGTPTLASNPYGTALKWRELLFPRGASLEPVAEDSDVLRYLRGKYAAGGAVV